MKVERDLNSQYISFKEKVWYNRKNMSFGTQAWFELKNILTWTPTNLLS